MGHIEEERGENILGGEYQFDEMSHMSICIKCDNNQTFQCVSSLRPGQDQDGDQGWGVSKYLLVNEEMVPETEIILPFCWV